MQQVEYQIMGISPHLAGADQETLNAHYDRMHERRKISAAAIAAVTVDIPQTIEKEIV